MGQRRHPTRSPHTLRPQPKEAACRARSLGDVSQPAVVGTRRSLRALAMPRVRRSVVQYTGDERRVLGQKAKQSADVERRRDAITITTTPSGCWKAACRCGWSSGPRASRHSASAEGGSHAKSDCGGANLPPAANSERHQTHAVSSRNTGAHSSRSASPTSDQSESSDFTVRKFEKSWCWQCKKCGKAGGWSQGDNAQEKAGFDTFNHRCG